MKSLVQYLIESLQIDEGIAKLSTGKTGIIVFDIDDTLLSVDPSDIHVWKKEPGKEEVALTPAEFAKDPDAKDHRSWFDYREFRDPSKVRQSIVNGTPILKNHKILDAYINAGYDFCFLTARSCEDVIKDALEDFFILKGTDNTLSKLEAVWDKELSNAVNDQYKNYPGDTDAEKKANVLTKLCKKYDKVVFVDDDAKNVKAARALKLDNLKVVKAWEKE